MNSFNPMIGINESNFSSLTGLNDIETITESSDESYTVQAFTFLTQFNEEYNELNKHFYKSILESKGDVVAVQEAYGDFFSKFKTIIDKFLAFIKNMFEKFIAKIASFVQSEKYLLKAKKTFDRFTNDDNFITDGYNYSFSPEIPMVDLSIKFDSALLGNLNKVSLSTIDNKDPMGINTPTKTINKMTRDLEGKLENGYYDIFRATVIGSVGSISESAFSSECFKKYRSNDAEPTNVTVSKGYINEALERIQEYKKTIKSIEETKTRINREYASIRDKIGKMIKPNSTEVSSTLRNIDLIGFDADSSLTDVTISYDTLTALDGYLRTISNQVQEMSNIHGIAFTTKMDAVKEQYKQDKRILYQALSVCQTTGKAINSVKESYDDEVIERKGSLWIM